MMPQIVKYILPSGSYYYNKEAPDYTEGLGNVLVTYKLYDEEFGEDHSEILERAKKTILERQSPNGAYYKTKDKKIIQIWYTDNLGVGLPEYLMILEK